jgi:hypothetical protein
MQLPSPKFINRRRERLVHIRGMTDRIGCLIGAAEGRDFMMHSRIGVLRALNRNVERILTDRKDMQWGAPEAQEGPTMTVLIYVKTSKQVGDPDHLKVFANPDARKHGLRKMTKARHSNMRSWSEARPRC